jgi:probable F420-dependent oxidoreductase
VDARPFRFGVQVSKAPSGRAWRDLARKVEDLGYSSLLMPDHLDEQWAPLVALTAAAEATSTLAVGTLVLGNDYRHPVVAAKELATLDLLSDGRLEAGIGAGWMTSDYEAAGIALDPPAVRVERLAEAVAVMKALWRDGSCEHVGRHYQVRGAKGYPLPHRRPGPLLVIGGGSRRVLSLAAREADIVGLNPSLKAGVIGPEAVASAAPDRYDERVRWVREAAGERLADIDLQCLTFFVRVGHGAADAVAAMASAAFGMSPEQAAEVPLALAGTVPEMVDVLHARRARWGVNYVVVHEAELESFAPVVAQLTGT